MISKNQKVKQTKEDRKKLRYALRMGFIAGGFVLLFGLSTFLLSLLSNDELQIPQYIPFPLMALGVFISWSINRKAFKDLSDGYKTSELYTIQAKDFYVDYEASSSVGAKQIKREHTFHLGMAGFKNYAIIYDNTRVRVDEDFWFSVSKEDIIKVYSAKYTKLNLGMELHQKKSICKIPKTDEEKYRVLLPYIKRYEQDEVELQKVITHKSKIKYK